MAGRRQGRLRKRFLRESVSLQKRAAQRAFDKDRHLIALCELDGAVGVGRLGGLDIKNILHMAQSHMWNGPADKSAQQRYPTREVRS